MRAPASRSAAISACAVGSLPAIGALPPRPTIAPSRTTIAPTGTSPRVPASRAIASACSIHWSSVGGIFEVEPVQDAVDDRREHQAGRREQDHAAKQRIDAVENLA